MSPKMCLHWQIIYENVVEELLQSLADVMDVLWHSCSFRRQNSLCNFGYLMLVQITRIARNNNFLN